MLKCSYKIPPLPLDVDVESKAVLKSVAAAYRALSDLRRQAAKVPNQGILIDTLALQEAQASSEIENIVTTQDEVFRIGPTTSARLDPRQKEVANYRDSLWVGHQGLLNTGGLITNNIIIGVFQNLKKNTGGFRNTPGTKLENEFTKDVVYVPPQTEAEISKHMSVLETFINEPDSCAWDPLVKMAVIHHQFESIHPFPDGNGRVGRILNVLFLVQQGLLDSPILYLSRFITQTKPDYYRLLQAVRDEGAWEDWILYMLRGVEATALETSDLLSGINHLLFEYKNKLREEHSRIYSHELLNTMFKHPYTRIEYVVGETGVGRQAAARHLDELAAAGFLEKTKIGRDNYYINVRLVDLFLNRPSMVSQ